jgi:hypothetical protein
VQPLLHHPELIIKNDILLLNLLSKLLHLPEAADSTEINIETELLQEQQ